MSSLFTVQVILKIKPYGIGDYKLMEKILVTGSCGFIGMHLCKYLLKIIMKY